MKGRHETCANSRHAPDQQDTGAHEERREQSSHHFHGHQLDAQQRPDSGRAPGRAGARAGAGSPAPGSPWASPQHPAHQLKFLLQKSRRQSYIQSSPKSVWCLRQRQKFAFNTSWTDVSFRNTGPLFIINQRSPSLCKYNEMSNWILKDRSATEAHLKLYNYTHQVIQL